MFISPAIRFPCHGNGANKIHFRDDRYLAAAATAALCRCDNPGYFGTCTANHSFGFASAPLLSSSASLPSSSSSFSVAESRSHPNLHGLRLHPRWRAIMGEEAWYQSISDYEEENYFNSPHLQHPQHSTALARKGVRDLLTSQDCAMLSMTDVTTATAAHQPHYRASLINANHDSDKHIWSDSRASIASETASLCPNNSIPTWDDCPDKRQTILPSQPPLNILHYPPTDDITPNEEPAEIFGDIDINRDIDTLVQAPLGFDSLPRSPQAPTLQSQRSHQSLSSETWPQVTIPTAAKLQHYDAYRISPVSPIMSIASQDDMSSSAPSPFQSVFGQTPTETSFESSLQTSSPMRRESRPFPIQKVRKSLPNSPIRPRASAQGVPYPPTRAASFGEFSLRGGSPANRDGSFNSVRARIREVSMPMDADERAEKDEFLVKSRRAGMSYRDIKRLGDFSEAESTLRGRYRMLTKSREERVRNPKWMPIDVVLLRKAVVQCCKGKNPAAVRIPWKEVANYISAHGGTYHFGNATCRKKWDELTALGFDQEVEEDEEDDMNEDGVENGVENHE